MLRDPGNGGPERDQVTVALLSVIPNALATVAGIVASIVAIIIVTGIVRAGKLFVPTSVDQMLPGDDVYFVVDTDHAARAMPSNRAAFGMGYMQHNTHCRTYTG